MRNGLHVLPEERIRLIMMYTGIYFDQGLHYWFQEEMGVSYLMDLLVFHDFNPIIDTTNTDTMLSGLAEGMLNLPMTRQLKGSWDMPANWLEEPALLRRNVQGGLPRLHRSRGVQAGVGRLPDRRRRGQEAARSPLAQTRGGWVGLASLLPRRDQGAVHRFLRDPGLTEEDGG